MTKREIKKLAQASYRTLDEKKAQEISSLLSRKDLKEYIRQLKLIEKTQEVIVALPNLNRYNKSDKTFENVFKNKQIIYQEDPSLILGTRITDNDMVYDYSLKAKLEETAKQMEQMYE